MNSYESEVIETDIPDSDIKIIDFKGEGNVEDSKKILEEGDWLTVYNDKLYLHFKFTQSKTISSITTFCGNKKASIKDVNIIFIYENQIINERKYQRSNNDKENFKTLLNKDEKNYNNNGILCSEIIFEVTSNYGEYYTGFNRIFFHEQILILDYVIKDMESKKLSIKDNKLNQYKIDPPIKSRFLNVEMLDINGGYYIGLNRIYVLNSKKEKIKNQKVTKFNGVLRDDLNIVTDELEKGGWFAEVGGNQTFLVDLGSETEVSYIELYFANQENRPKFVNISKTGGLNLINKLEDFFSECLKLNAKIGQKIYKTLVKEIPNFDNIEQFADSSFYKYLITPILNEKSPKFPIEIKKDFTDLFQLFWFQTNWKSLKNNLVPASGMYDHHGISSEMINNIKSTSKVISVEAKSHLNEFFSTGLFLYPAHKMKITIIDGKPDGWYIRIGSQTDTIPFDNEQKKYLRYPSITIVEKLENEMTLTSPYGGLVLIESSGKDQCLSKLITIEISGPEESPYFTFETKDFTLNSFNSPWVEIEGNYVNLTIPIRSFKNISEENILESMKLWDKVYKSHCELLKPICLYRKERIVPDNQISVGYMHSGYPIMTGYDICEYDGEKLPKIFGLNKEDNWGLLHELGHNFQRDYWCFEGTIEVTVNLFTLYTYQKVFGIDINSSHPGLLDAKKKSKNYIKKPNFEEWKNDPFLALYTYIEVIEKFGFEPLKKTFLEYELEIEKGINPPLENKEIIEVFIRKFSKNCGVDLRKHFNSWGIPFSNFKDESLTKLKTFIYH